MNEAVARAARQRDAGRRRSGGAAAPHWRPFQLAFILLNLAASPTRAHPDREIVDLLFFPTGGGKTEAYLGLAAFTIAHRRLTQSRASLGAGVAVLMRYTLRLLTLDQLSRAAGVVCALELMRESRTGARTAAPARRLADRDRPVGRLGRDAQPARQAGNGKRRTRPSRRVRRYQQDGPRGAGADQGLPVVRRRRSTRDSVRLRPERQRHRANMEIRCANTDCDFTGDRALPVADRRRADLSPPARLPDRDRRQVRRPALGRRGRRVLRPCRPARRLGLLRRGRRRARARRCNGASFDPPDLIIQDELHLITGPLGTVAGALRDGDRPARARAKSTASGVRPKIVASTATVRRARDADPRRCSAASAPQIFPPPGPDRRDSFFAAPVAAE